MKKKSTKKKLSASKMAPKRKKAPTLPSVSGDACFWVNNGPVVSNMKELHQALIEMSDEQFAHHVSKNKNDFALWVLEMFDEKTHSKKLHKAKSKQAAASVIHDALKRYR